jgi:hypothetical protein
VGGTIDIGAYEFQPTPAAYAERARRQSFLEPDATNENESTPGTLKAASLSPGPALFESRLEPWDLVARHTATDGIGSCEAMMSAKPFLRYRPTLPEIEKAVDQLFAAF